MEGVVAPGSRFTADVTLVNEGLKKFPSGSVVRLVADDEEMSRMELPALSSGEMLTLQLEGVVHPLAEDHMEVYAEVMHGSDENPANNASGVARVRVALSRMPAPENLRGILSAKAGALLEWDATDLGSGVAEATVESFEDGEAFAHEYEGWTFIDADGFPVGGVSNNSIPGIEPGVTTASYFVFDSGDDYPQFNATYAARTGNRFLAALFSYEDLTTNDWAISPVLSGEAQTISFYARSYSADYPEKIEMLYSTGGTERDDFISVRTVDEVSGEWTYMEFDVPEGARHFAIRSCGTGAFMLMLDDFTFIPDKPVIPVLKGYNVYRNGELITAAPVAGRSYEDLTGPNAANRYRVTAVYDRGESRGSNEVTVTTSGVDAAAAGGVFVSGGRGVITVSGATGPIEVFSTDGREAARAEGTGATTVISIEAGIYLVRTGGVTSKIVVR